MFLWRVFGLARLTKKKKKPLTSDRTDLSRKDNPGFGRNQNFVLVLECLRKDEGEDDKTAAAQKESTVGSTARPSAATKSIQNH